MKVHLRDCVLFSTVNLLCVDVIHKPKLIAQAPVVNDKVSDFHKVRYLQRVNSQSGLHLYHH